MFNLKGLISAEKEAFSKNRIKYTFELLIFFTLFIFFFTLAAFSYSSLHLIPIGLMVILIALITIYKLVYNRLLVDRTIASVFLFLLCVVISCCFNGFSRFYTTYIYLPVMFFFLYNFFITDGKFLKKAYALFFISQLFFALYYTYFYRVEIFSLNFSRIGGYFGDENVIGSYFAMTYAIGLYYTFFKKKYLLIPVLAVLLFLGVTTGSKAFLLMVFVITVAQIIMFFGKKRWYISVGIFVALIAIFIPLSKMKFMEFIMVRIKDLIDMITSKNQAADVSTSSRLFYIKEGLFLFLRNPVVGLGAFGFAQNSLYGYYSHNSIVESLSNFGFIATCFWLYPLGKTIKSKKDKSQRALYISIFMFVFISEFLLVQFIDKFYYIQLALLCAFNINEEKDILMEVKIDGFDFNAFVTKTIIKIRGATKSLFLHIFKLLPLKKNVLLFESNCDLSDSSYALFTYIKSNYPKYKCIWVLSDKSSKKICKSLNIKFVMLGSVRGLYYIAVCKNLFFTHRSLTKMPPRKGQSYYNLWHGSPFKRFNGELIDNNVNKTIFVTQTDYTLDLYYENYGIDKNLSMLSNHLRIDFFDPLFSVEEDKKVEDYFSFSSYRKNIIFLPTFRRDNAKSFDFFENFPLYLSKEDFKALDDFLFEMNIQLIIKLHPMADKADVSFRNDLKNIRIVTSQELVENSLQLYAIMGHCDALLSDFSSVVFDYMALDKPIGYVLSDFEAFKNNKNEGFIFSDDLQNYFVGDKIYDLLDLQNFIRKIAEDEDSFASERRELAKKYLDIDCECGQNSKAFCEKIGL